jgi:hypothetical protein
MRDARGASERSNGSWLGRWRCRNSRFYSRSTSRPKRDARAFILFKTRAPLREIACRAFWISVRRVAAGRGLVPRYFSVGITKIYFLEDIFTRNNSRGGSARTRLAREHEAARVPMRWENTLLLFARTSAINSRKFPSRMFCSRGN